MRDDAEERALVVARAEKTAVSPAMRFALSTGAVLFHIGALAQLIAAIWAGWAVALLVGGGSLLANTRGLDAQSFETCLWVAAIIDALLLLTVCGGWLRRATADEARAEADATRFGDRHPVISSIAWLCAATALASLAAWWPSRFFPASWTTVIVLSTIGFAGATGAAAIAILLSRALDRVQQWGLATQYRAGLLTGAFVLLGTGGSAALAHGWYEEPVDDASDALGVARMDEGGHFFVEDTLQALCIGAAEVDADRTRGAGAPACSFLHSADPTTGGPSGTGDPDCYTYLWERAVPTARERLRRDFGFSAFDADDVATHAMEETCTKQPPPLDTVAYFRTVARNRAVAQVTKERRHLTCDALASSKMPTCDPVDPPTVRAAKLRALWDDALCQMDPTTATIVRRHLADDEKFPAIAAALNLTREQVRDRFHNAMKKLRRSGIADCLHEAF